MHGLLIESRFGGGVIEDQGGQIARTPHKGWSAPSNDASGAHEQKVNRVSILLDCYGIGWCESIANRMGIDEKGKCDEDSSGAKGKKMKNIWLAHGFVITESKSGEQVFRVDSGPLSLGGKVRSSVESQSIHALNCHPRNGYLRSP
ncbi:hypothetical protein AG1IA_05152 [Rhizoctonia solani AG-1 IA]|uniref:Uncharacterized protein n=1 Tax=Thanatephorus cucumeris (strain AG1-IA) TaxID=983506 RepID=L8WVN5_THACA|nr:hypothetical protein AG1IA_05152 [Rhizoctonia solani AG-1 IA]